MQKHVLHDLRGELEKTYSLLEHYRLSGIKEYFFSLFGRSFKKVLARYAKEKEDILMSYATLHYDIEKDIKLHQTEEEEVEHIRLGISSLTHKIELGSKSLAQLNAHSDKQESILQHEKSFFAQVVKSFHADLQQWVNSHEKEIFGEVSVLKSDTRGKNSLSQGKKLLERQKEKFESHMQNLSQNKK